MVEHRFSGLQRAGHRLELRLLFGGQEIEETIHIAGEHRLFQQSPAMASGDIVQASVFGGGIIESEPAGEVLYRTCPCPVGIILMPGYDPAVEGWLIEELIVPEAHGMVAEELAGRHHKGRIPEDIMVAGRDPPGAQGVKNHLGRVGGFVGAEFVIQMMGRVGGIHDLHQFLLQDIDLFFVQQFDIRQIAFGFKKLELFPAEAVSLPFRLARRLTEDVGNRLGEAGEIGDGHGESFDDEDRKLMDSVLRTHGLRAEAKSWTQVAKDPNERGRIHRS